MSGVGTCDFNGNSSVSLSSPNWLPGSTYTINASHSPGGQTSASTTTPGASPSNVISVEFQLIETDDLPIDLNPNTGNGLRIFPDDKIPNDPKNRRKIRVKAKYGQPVAGVDIYFEAFDMDDPSSDDEVIDPNGFEGYDNKDEIDSSGSFSILFGASGCQIISISINPLIKCLTNSLGEASVDFTVSRQPGDNFSIAASSEPLELGQVTVSGINLLKGNGQQVPFICPNSNVCRTKLLTVWRRLHIEVDSMGVVSGNKVNAINSSSIVKKIGFTQTTIFLKPDTPLEPRRFKGGVLVSGNKKFRIHENLADSVELTSLFGNSLKLSPNESVVIYDDDDYNNSNGRNLTGDQGENVTNPGYMFDGLNSMSDLSDDNILALAYIKPFYDALDSRDDNTFRLNLPPPEPLPIGHRDNVRSFFDKWDSSTTNTDRKFWSVYILGSYQPEITNDGDGLEPNITFGIVDEITNIGNGMEGSGALIFLEMLRSKENSNYSMTKTNPNSTQVVVAHEVGHLFGCNHGEGEIMGSTAANGFPISNKFSVRSLNIIRSIQHP